MVCICICIHIWCVYAYVYMCIYIYIIIYLLHIKNYSIDPINQLCLTSVWLGNMTIVQKVYKT